ncbi:DUF4132 domain-containing protein [Streptomyces nigrescens]|uniref:DUF4132 domain-containing protein n=1 Tax=Streptomyces nigrescens TaxID=1920 RepID=UPI0021C4513C|nr:DUF4132 domain-containing protein [Streptomyces nigrescens]
MTTPLVWVSAARGYELALDGTTLRCRRTDGRDVKSPPKGVLADPVGERFAALRDRLVRHEEECRDTVESWLLSGVPVPAGLLARIWQDPGWRSCLEHLVVHTDGRTGLLVDVAEDGRVSVRDESGLLYGPPAGASVTLLHPALLGDLGPWHRLLEAHGVAQGWAQLDRRVYRRPEGTDPQATGIDAFEGEPFTAQWRARMNALENGFVVRGGFAVAKFAERFLRMEARCWVGEADPGASEEAGRLLWVDEAEHPVAVGTLGPVAWSEGLRMAELIYGGATNDDA